ncbi:MAG: ABC transporter ATP-binding protein [Myxococcales bacterium]|nr:ABC transporter ATP-binding protein [Myxococcales bacterium]
MNTAQNTPKSAKARCSVESEAARGDVVLDVRRVSLTLGAKRVLDHVCFRLVDRVREDAVTGQIACVLGPSGAGKTRLLRILAGLDAPDSGEVLGPGGKPVLERKVGMVFQDYPLLRHRTVKENLTLAGRIAGLDARARNERADELLAMVRLESKADRYPAQLSGGERQRVAIAQQVVAPRRLLLLDEPFSGLDPAALVDVRELVTRVAHQHQLNTVVIVTHDVRAAVAISDTILLLGKGPNGARVVDTYDLVDMGIAWKGGEGRACEALARVLERRFRDVS